jgi:hypothetical protein
MSEHNLQKSVASYLNNHEKLFKSFTWFHVPNSLRASRSQAARHKSYGMRAGVPDVIIFTPEGKTIFIELKVKKGTLSAQQKRFHEKLSSLGHKVYLIKTDSPHEAVNEVERILEQNGVKA